MEHKRDFVNRMGRMLFLFIYLSNRWTSLKAIISHRGFLVKSSDIFSWSKNVFFLYWNLDERNRRNLFIYSTDRWTKNQSISPIRFTKSRLCSINEWTYRFRVIVGFLCPNISDNDFTSVPHSIALVANVWRRAWKPWWGIFSFFRSNSKLRW